MKGPSIHISASCGGCEYLTSEYYAVQSDTGFTHTCALNGLGSHHFDTPAPGKCPFYPAVPDVSELERQLAESERERDALREERSLEDAHERKCSICKNTFVARFDTVLPCPCCESLTSFEHNIGNTLAAANARVAKLEEALEAGDWYTQALAWANDANWLFRYGRISRMACDESWNTCVRASTDKAKARAALAVKEQRNA